MDNKLNYKEYGDGYPIIILHGFLGMLDNWHSFSRKLSEDYRVISIDQRNHGKSFHSEDFDYKILAKDLHQFLQQMEIDKCGIIGHSMGGKTVMQYLSDYNSIIDKAVIVDIAPRAYDGGHQHILDAMTDLDLSQIEKRSDAQDFLVERLRNVGVVQFLLKNLNRDTDGNYSWKANLKVLYDNYENVSAGITLNEKVTVPSLFVRGTQSNYITKEDEKEISKSFSQADVIDIDAGHWVHAEQPELLLEAVRNFFL